jgi:hypothetical protein
MTCTHDRPKTAYSMAHGNQSATQAGPYGSGLGHNCTVYCTGTTYYGDLCDACARDAGLSPVAIGRELVGLVLRRNDLD